MKIREYYGYDGKDTIDGFSYYCLKGLDNDTNDFLSAITDLYNNYKNTNKTRNDLIKLIIDNLKNEDFKKINNGILPVIFRDIDDKRISAYQNFLEYLVSNERLDYNYFWELLTKKNSWLFKNGLNLIIVERDNIDNLELICPKFNLYQNIKDDADYAIIVKYNVGENTYFSNVYHFHKSGETSIFNNKKMILNDDSEFFNNDIPKKLFEMLILKSKDCVEKPNVELLNKIMSSRTTDSIKIAPLFKPEFIYNLLTNHDKFKINKLVVQSKYSNKVIGLLLNQPDKGQLFIPTLTSGRFNKIPVIEIKNIDDSSFMNYLDAIDTLKNIYETISFQHENINVKCNVYPVEIVLNDKEDKIIAIVTNSNSIIPIKPTRKSNRLSLLPVSKRKYYKELDKHIREKPIGVLKYSKDIDLKLLKKIEEKGLYKIDRKIFNNNYKKNHFEKYFVGLTNINDKDFRTIIPVKSSNLTKEEKLSFDEEQDIVEVINSSHIGKYYSYNKQTEVLSKLYKLSNKTLGVRPIRIVLNDKKQIDKLILENGTMIPIQPIDFNTDFSMVNFVKEYDNKNKDLQLAIEDKIINDERVKTMVKLEYEREIDYNIRYEISRFLQQPENLNLKNKIIKVLGGVKDLLYTRLVRKELFNIFLNIVEGLSWSIDRKDPYWKTMMKKYKPLQFKTVGKELEKEECLQNPFYRYFEKPPGTIEKAVNEVVKVLTGGKGKQTDIIKDQCWGIQQCPGSDKSLCPMPNKCTNIVEYKKLKDKEDKTDFLKLNPHHLCKSHLKNFKANGGYLQYGYWIDPIKSKLDKPIMAKLELFERKHKKYKDKKKYDELFADGYDIKKIDWSNYNTSGFKWQVKQIKELWFEHGFEGFPKGEFPESFKDIMEKFMDGKNKTKHWFNLHKYDDSVVIDKPKIVNDYNKLHKKKKDKDINKLSEGNMDKIFEKLTPEQKLEYPYLPIIIVDNEISKPDKSDKKKKKKKKRRKPKFKDITMIDKKTDLPGELEPVAAAAPEPMPEAEPAPVLPTVEDDVKIKTSNDEKSKISGPKANKSGCYLAIPKNNLIYKDINDNLKNKLYRLVDEIIRDKNRQIELIDGLVPKSVLKDKYIPLQKNEIIVTQSDLLEEQFINELYKIKKIKNFRVNDYGDVIDTVDFTNPTNLTNISSKKLKKVLSIVEIYPEPIECEITETGNTKKLF